MQELASWRELSGKIIANSQPFFVGTGVTTQEEVDQAYDQMLVEMMQDDFRGIMYLLTAWGEKP